MNKKITIPLLLFIFVLIFSVSLLLKGKSKNQANNQKENKTKTEIILFYGISCPHCKEVEDYIKKNDIEDKISFVQKEVYFNRNNAKELEDKAKICGFNTNEIGVPFLWDGEKCLIGSLDIINFFANKTSSFSVEK